MSDMSVDIYSEREWLNPDGHPSTGSVCAYSGPSSWDPDEQLTTFEVADCHGKVRLHPTKTDTSSDFAEKLELLAAVALRFAGHLRKANGQGVDAAGKLTAEGVKVRAEMYA